MAQGDALTAGDSATTVLDKLRNQQTPDFSITNPVKPAPAPEAPAAATTSAPPLTYNSGSDSKSAIPFVLRTDTEQRVRQSIAPIRAQEDELLRQAGEEQQNRPLPPSMPKVEPPPPYEVREPLKAFGSFAGALAVFAGLLTRRPLVTALNASADAMIAAKEGDLSSYQQAVSVWQKQKDEAFKQADYAQKLYEDATKNINSSVEAKMAQVRALAAREDNERLLAVVDQGDWKAVQDYLKDSANLNQRTQNAAATLDLHRKETEFRIWSLLNSPPFNAYQQFLKENPNASAEQRAEAARKTGAAEVLYENHAFALQRAIDRVYNAMADAEKNGKFVTGIGGKLQSFEEWATNSDSVEAARYKSAMGLLKNAYQDFRQDRRSGTAADDRLNEAIQGLGHFTSLKQAAASIDLLSNEVGDVIQSRGYVDPLRRDSINDEIGQIKKAPEELQPMLYDAIKENKMPPEAVPYFMSLAQRESGWDPNKLGGAGDKGLLQIIPGTAQQFGIDYDKLFDPAYNLKEGGRLFMKYWKDTGGNGPQVLTMWNRGEGKPDPSENRKYVEPALKEAARVMGIDATKPPQPDYFFAWGKKDGKPYWYKDLHEKNEKGEALYDVIPATPNMTAPAGQGNR